MSRKRKTIVEEVVSEPTIPLEAVEQKIDAVIEAKIEPQPDPIIDKYLQLAEACRSLPTAKMNPTDRWYGEQFYPQYENAMRKIRVLLA